MRFVSGLILIDAPHSALNMLGTDKSMADRNKMVVKKFKRGKESYIYVSAQSWRYWWRQTLERKFNWNLSPLEKVESKNQVYTSANPIKYEDDDVFGYMRASENLNVTRISPLKNTPLISVLPLRNSVTSDFANASRHEGDPVIYESEFYSTVLKGAFSLDLDSIGTFLFKDKAGFRNLVSFDKQIEEIKNSKMKKEKKEKEIRKLEKSKEEILWEEEYLKVAKETCIELLDNEWIMKSQIKARRARETIEALRYLTGGAKQTLFLTDVTPKFIILAMFEGGLNPFISDVVYEENGRIVFDENALIARIHDFKDIISPLKIFIGIDEGFMKEWKPKITKIKQEFENMECNDKNEIKIISGSIGKTIENFSDEIKKYYGVEDDKNKA